jgi:hypothetical protein
MTSDTMNNTIPNLSLSMVFFEWAPSPNLSRETSRHHRYEITIEVKSEAASGMGVFQCIRIVSDIIVLSALPEAQIGHGLTVTRWNTLVLFVIFTLTLLGKELVVL